MYMFNVWNLPCTSSFLKLVLPGHQVKLTQHTVFLLCQLIKEFKYQTRGKFNCALFTDSVPEQSVFNTSVFLEQSKRYSEYISLSLEKLQVHVHVLY